MYAFITRFGDHDVVVMAITNPQDVGCYTVTATGIHKALHCLLILERGQSPQCLFYYTHLNYANITMQTREANSTHSL